MENFVNFHVLISHSPACLNRDDMNMQKSAVFGGVRRVRISSQSLKRALRDSAYYKAHLGQPSIRTRDLASFAERCVIELGSRYPEDLVRKTIAAMVGKEGIADLTQANAVAPWAIAEVAKLCELVASNPDADQKALEKLVKKHADELRESSTMALDIALSGRMATSGLMTSVDGALAVAHAITTHAVDSDIDWFTAVDDLVSDAGQTGAGHLATQEFSSGVFYRYASLNLGQLQKNLGGASRERALDIARHVAHLLATVVPRAKQQAFAAHNLADCVLVSFSDQPISLANAFELPVKARERNELTGFRMPSQRRLLAHWKALNDAYDLDRRTAAFCLEPNVDWPEKLAVKKSLKELTAWIAVDGQA
jgi:CRISPR system Cascade subunit CasC